MPLRPFPPQGWCLSIAVVAWLALTIVGSALLLIHAHTPGAAAGAPARWPADTRLPSPAARPTLVMFLHPHCPCSRASVGELAVLMARAAGRLDARCVFFQTKDADAEWSQTDLWRAAAAIPGVTVERDCAGDQARLFATETSGQALLYGADGTLIFQGGITASRGHSGDNEGRAAVQRLLAGAATNVAATRVFGCPLSAAKPPAR